MLRLKNILVFMLLISSLILSLTGCGGGGNSLTPEQQAVSDAFNGTTLDPTTLIDSSLNLPRSTTRASEWMWDTADVSNLSLNKSLVNIEVNGENATATGTFTISGHYNIGGTTSSGGSWSASHDFTLTGSGTIYFTKTGDTWAISNIQGILLKSNVSKSPSIVPGIYTSSALQGTDLIINATITSNNSEFKLFAYAVRGYGIASSTPIGITLTSPYNLSRTPSTSPTAPAGCTLGGIAVYELDEITPDSSYELYFSIFLKTIIITQ